MATTSALFARLRFWRTRALRLSYAFSRRGGSPQPRVNLEASVSLRLAPETATRQPVGHPGRGRAPGCPTVAPHASLRGATPRIRRAEGQSPAPVMVNAGTLGWVPLGALRVGSARHIRTVCREPVCRRAAHIEESRNRPRCFRYPWRTGCWPLPCSRAGACGTRTGRGADDEALR
jgi:hypothetical protein